MRKRFYSFWILLFTTLLLSASYAAADEEEVPEDLPEEETEYLEADGDELLQQYIDQALLGEQPVLFRKASIDLPGRLSEVNRIIYDSLEDAVISIAAGETDTSVVAVAIPAEKTSIRWYAEDLGIESIGYINDAGKVVLSPDFKEAFYDAVGYDIATVMNTLFRTHPNEMYWFGNLYSYSSFYSIYKDKERENTLYAKMPATLTVRLFAAPDYAVRGEGEERTETCIDPDGNEIQYDPFTIDLSQINRVNQAIANAQQIAAENPGTNDYETLYYFFSEVSTLSDYNYAAVRRYYSPVDYGDPWQIIYLFDGDPETKVVCEGFAKGMQYLCEMTEFEEDIFCFNVVGYLDSLVDGQFHMWNILRMEDGKNYLIDATNSKPDNPWGFLAPYTDGSVEEGYTVGTHWYYYDDEYVRPLYTEEELTLSDEPYGMPDAPSGLSLETAENGLLLSWDPVEKADGYTVFRKEEADADFEEAAELEGGEITSWVDESVGNGVYEYMMQAWSDRTLDRLESDYSAIVSGASLLESSITSISNTAGGIKLKWEKNSEADGYIISRAYNYGTFKKVTKITTPAETSWTDFEPENGKICSYTIRSYKILNKTSWYSAYAPTVTLARMEKPVIASVYNQADSTALKWTRNYKADGYIVYRSVDGGAYTQAAVVSGGTTLSWKDPKGTSAGKLYTYQVEAYRDYDGIRSRSARSGAKTVPRLNRAVLSKVEQTSAGMKLTWPAASNADGYILYRRTDGTDYEKIKTVASPGAGSFTDKTAVEKGVTYYYRITAYKTVDSKKYESFYSTVKKWTRT